MLGVLRTRKLSLSVLIPTYQLERKDKKMENVNFAIGNIAAFIRIPLEKKLSEFKDFVYEKNNVPKISWKVWGDVTNAVYDDNYDALLDALYRLKYESIDDLTTDDIAMLKGIFKIKENDEIEKMRKLSIISNKIQKELAYQDSQEKKPKAIITALNTTYRQLYGEDEAIEDLLNEYFAGCDEVTLDMENIYQVADYAIKKMFNSFEFVKNYISTWRINNFSVISETANRLLKKYKGTDHFNKLRDIIKSSSSSYVYSFWHNQFIFLDNQMVGHTDAVMYFVASWLGYTNTREIPLSEYPRCDEFIQSYIEIKAANDERQSLGIFKGGNYNGKKRF